MQRILSAWCTAAIMLTFTAPVRGQGAPQEPPANGAASVPAPPHEEASVPEPSSAADGTTSVVVPPAFDQPPPAAPPSPPVAVADPQATEPPAPPVGTLAPPPPPSAASPPPSGDAPFTPLSNVPPPPPPSETAAVLETMLEPFKGKLPGVSGTLDPQLYARPMPLLEPLVRSGDRSRRLWIVQAYWKVSAGYAIVRSSAEALERLELVAPGTDPHDRAVLDVAAAAARADLADARARLAGAHQELVDLARLPVGETLPWPIDRPLTDPYQTHFEAIFANRIATGRVRTIVRILPARHESVTSRALAVASATKAIDMAEADHARGKRPIESVIAAHAAVVAQQAALVEAVRIYNVEIAEYAMAVADLSTPDEQFVAMLIASPAPWQAQPIAPASVTVTPPLPGTTAPLSTGLPPQLAPAITGVPIE